LIKEVLASRPFEKIGLQEWNKVADTLKMSKIDVTGLRCKRRTITLLSKFKLEDIQNSSRL